MDVSACHVPVGDVPSSYMDGRFGGRAQVSCIPLVRIALVRSRCPVFPFGTGREGSLLRCRGVLSMCRHLADTRRALGHHPLVRLDRRDALACVAQAVVLVDGMGRSGQSGGESLEGDMKKSPYLHRRGDSLLIYFKIQKGYRPSF